MDYRDNEKWANRIMAIFFILVIFGFLGYKIFINPPEQDGEALPPIETEATMEPTTEPEAE